MKKLHATVIALTMGGVLAGSAVQAFADDAKPGGQPVGGVAVQDTVAIAQLPTEVQGGSIEVGDAGEQAFAGMAKLSAMDALRIASRAAPGTVVEMQLDAENGFLMWEVTEQDTAGRELQLKLDAGNGRLLAAEVGDHQEDRNDNDHEDRGESKHSSWKFWEDGDKDEHGGDRD